MENKNTIEKHQGTFSEEEKAILENFFIKRGNGCKNNYQDFLADYVLRYGSPKGVIKDSPYGVDNRRNKVLGQLRDWEYDSKHVMWGDEEGNNLVTWVFSQKKVKPSRTMIQQMENLRPDWNHCNNKGDNVLHILAMGGNLSLMAEVMERFHVDATKNGSLGKSVIALIPSIILRESSKEGQGIFGILNDLPIFSSALMSSEEHLISLGKDALRDMRKDVHDAQEALIGNFMKSYSQTRVGAMDFIGDEFNTIGTILDRVIISLTTASPPQRASKRI